MKILESVLPEVETMAGRSPCAQGGVKERVHPQDGLGIAADAVPLGRQAVYMEAKQTGVTGG